MKSVSVNCLQCGKDLTDKSQRAKFCSGACKIKFNRYTRKGFTVTPNRGEVSENTGLYKDDVTVTDRAFIDDAADRGLVDWYRFDDETFGRDCWHCRKDFRTRLKLNRYCSPECRDGALKPSK